jgi:hypothetical protein
VQTTGCVCLRVSGSSTHFLMMWIIDLLDPPPRRVSDPWVATVRTAGCVCPRVSGSCTHFLMMWITDLLVPSPRRVSDSWVATVQTTGCVCPRVSGSSTHFLMNMLHLPTGTSKSAKLFLDRLDCFSPFGGSVMCSD